jgi:hypothetical protein
MLSTALKTHPASAQKQQRSKFDFCPEPIFARAADGCTLDIADKDNCLSTLDNHHFTPLSL